MGGGLPDADSDEFEIELDDGLDDDWFDAPPLPSDSASLRTGSDLDVIEDIVHGANFEAEAPSEELWGPGDPAELRELWGRGWDIHASLSANRLWADEPELGPPVQRRDVTPETTDPYELPLDGAPEAQPATDAYDVPVDVGQPDLALDAPELDLGHFDEAPLLPPMNIAHEATATITRPPPEVTEPLEVTELTDPLVDPPGEVVAVPAPPRRLPTWAVVGMVLAAPVITLAVMGSLAAVLLGSDTPDPTVPEPVLAVPEAAPQPEPEPEPVVEPEPEPEPEVAAPKPRPRPTPRPAPVAAAPKPAPAPAPAPAPVVEPEPEPEEKRGFLGLGRKKKRK